MFMSHAVLKISTSPMKLQTFLYTVPNFAEDILAYLKSALGGGLNAEMEGAWGKFMDIMVAEVKTEL